MNVLVIKPGLAPQCKNIRNTLPALQKAVDGYIEAVYPFDDPVAIICNEEGKLNGLPPNRALFDEDGHCYDIICGTFLVVGLKGERFCSLTPKQLVDFALKYAIPERFLQSGEGGVRIHRTII